MERDSINMKRVESLSPILLFYQLSINLGVSAISCLVERYILLSTSILAIHFFA